ncbi:MAG: hypothetical protein SAJ12_23680 [Jaaginema sp. PMC 1079.18]|nr:hypothetical protein [Jaaginema sp. PMC 1080.18]MEC4853994.1 hypothetical protein [Jaaginema sp. PMC 1079.18]
MMNFWNWLWQGESTQWRELKDEDLAMAKQEADYWKKQKEQAFKYVTLKGQSLEDEALARGAFKMLPVAQARARAIDTQISEIARLETKDAPRQ